MKISWISMLAILIVGLCATARAEDRAEVDSPQSTVRCRHGAVVCVSGAAAKVGASILKDGGSAVDGAIATAFALAVTHPAAGNLGGGGYMLVVPAAGDALVIDFRETA